MLLPAQAQADKHLSVTQMQFCLEIMDLGQDIFVIMI